MGARMAFLTPSGDGKMPILDASGRYGDTTIELWTRAGNPIENTQVWEHSRFEWHLLGEMLKRFTNAERVSEACPVYNCHGLTFGSRRTQVTDVVYPILADDGFDVLPSEKDIRPGDIIVYCSARGEVVHSGFIVWRKFVEIVPGSKTVIPMVWSKWGKGYEMVHAVADCPYLEDEGSYLRYYRLKRWTPPAAKPAQPLVRTV
jgi:hypothetical protein